MNPAYQLALQEVGTVEWKDGHNPKVLAYFKDSGHAYVKDDETAWCAAFVGAMLARAGIKPSGKLTARSYLDWGHPVDLADARPGDIVVIPRGNSAWQGHVFFFVKKSGAFVEGLGGNQADSVNVQRFQAKKILGVRRPPRLVEQAAPKPTPKPASTASVLKPGAISGAPAPKAPPLVVKKDPAPSAPVSPPPQPAQATARKGRIFNLKWAFATAGAAIAAALTYLGFY